MQWNEFENILGFKLNEQQKKAVMAVDGPTLLLAVPGSGKTTVLVTRLGYMIFCKGDRKSTRLNSSHGAKSRMPSSA